MQPDRDYPVEFEGKTYFYLDRIREIDAILKGPVQTLIRLAEEVKRPKRVLKFPAKHVIYFPPWISENVMPKEGEHLLTWSLCSETLQRVWRVRRRFTWLEKEDKDVKKLKDLIEKVVGTFTPANPSRFDNCVRLLNSHAFGGLNPLTASLVFRVFLSSGEAEAHGPIGFLAFFAMLWALRRRFRDPLNIGAVVEPWEPSAYVTANCLLPIKTLQGICLRRARLLKQVSEHLGELWKPAVDDGKSRLWNYAVKLEELTATLLDLSELAIDQGKSLRACATVVAAECGKISVNQNNQRIYKKVLAKVTDCIFKLGKKEVKVLGAAEGVLKGIGKQIIPMLTRSGHTDLPGEWGFRFREDIRKSYVGEYWKDLRSSAEASLKFCKDALEKLQSAAQGCSSGGPAFVKRILKNVDKKDRKSWAAILKKIKLLADANEAVSGLMEEPVDGAARWCRSVVNREIAYASAGNLTDFDPSELVSGIAVAVRWNLMTTSLEVSDAIKKALEGARPDGSWSQGQPFYSPDYATSISTRTSDIVWTLTSAIEKHPEIKVADRALFQYVHWLERTRTQLGDQVGWASDRLRHPRKIHLATTALSINALLEIRDLAEYRLWELCKTQFPIVPGTKRLQEIRPVDLGAKHGSRLHSRIAGMARKAQRGDKDADYSLVLHGPPGSSKTAVAQALAAEMWKTSSRWAREEPRLVRITPADFTRMGEDRVDALARHIFDLLSHVRGVTILFDEIDDLLRRRDTRDASLRFLDLVVPAMLNRLADLREVCPTQEICFLLATNYVEKIEPALIRKGRIDHAIPVVYPDWESRLAIIDDYKKFTKSQKMKIAAATARWPYQTILAACTKIQASPAQLDEILEESALEPDYPGRLRKRASQELVNEYVHYWMADARDLAGFMKWTAPKRTSPNWKGKLKRIWKEEGRKTAR